MDKIKIRRCEIKDAEAIYKLNKNEMGYEYPVKSLCDNLGCLLDSLQECILVAESDGEVIGYVHLKKYLLTYSDLLTDILGIAVDRHSQGKRVGQALLSEAEKWAASVGAKGVRLVSGKERTGAHQFYEKCGYFFSKNQKNYKKFF